MRLDDEGTGHNNNNMENGNSHQENGGDNALLTTAVEATDITSNGDAIVAADSNKMKCVVVDEPSSNADEESESLASSSVIQEEEEDDDDDNGDDRRPRPTLLPDMSSASVRRPVAVSVSVGGESLMAMTPTSPRSITTASMSASDDMVEHENETMRDRVSDLERKVHDQNDEITCLRATLADALRRINTLESGKEHVQINHVMRDPRLRHPDGHVIRTPGGLRRPISGAYSNAHDPIASRRSIANIYQSTGSLHSDGHSSNSMSPAPSPSPTHAGLHHHHHHHPHGRASTAPVRSSLASRDGQLMPPPPPSSPAAGSGNSTPLKQRNLSGSMSNLSLSGSRKWNSTSDFRDQSPGPNGSMARRFQVGSMQSLRSPFGSQQNLSDRGLRHGTKDAIYNDEDGTVRFFIRGRPVTLYAPTDLVDSYSLGQVSPAPPVKPRLEWVYGYRGRDARSNLFLLPTGEMVYFVAAVVVLFNAEEHSQRHYLGHTEDIKCLVVHPNKMLIATGQTAGHDRREGRAHVRVWNSVSLQTLHVIGLGGDFERSVVCVSFSKADGGNLLVTVDEGPDHTMSVWDWSRGDRGTKVTETKCSNETVVTAEFHPLEAGLIVCIGKGHVNFWQLDSTALTLSRKTGLFDQRDKPKYVTCLAFSFTGDVLTGDSNGNVFVWGRGYNAVTKALRKVHDGPIFSLCVLKDGSIVTGGGKDRRLVQFDTVYKRTGLEAELPEHLGSVRTISQGRGSQLLLGSTRNFVLQGTFELGFQEIVTGHVDEVWALAAHPQQSQFISAGYDMHIHLWDALAHRAVWSSSLGGQAQSACFSSTGEVIVVGLTSGKWMVLDSQTREVYGVHQDGIDAIQTVRFSPDDKMLALGSRDGVIYMYQAAEGCKKFSRMGRCVGDAAKRRSSAGGSTTSNTVLSSNQITHLDWSADSTYLQSNSGDYELIYWTASICRPVTNQTTMRDVDWSSQTCILSFGTIGVWPETVDGTEIYTCARTRNKRLLATGDDFGKIKLFASPATQPKSLFHTVGGHSSHVTHLEFLQDDTRMISSGGRDTALMQWVLS